MEKRDVAIIGSGLAGLSAAKRMEQAGQKVVLIEKSKHLGGHLLSFERGALTFEVGVHYLADVGEESPWKKACDALHLNFKYHKLDKTFEELYWEKSGDSFFYTSPLGEFIARLQQQFPLEYRALSAYKETLELCWELARGLEFPLRTKDLVKKVISQPKMWPLIPLAFENLEHTLKVRFGFAESLYDILSLQHLLLGARPSELSSLLSFLVHRYYFEEACFPEGGGKEMIRQLTDRTQYPKLTNASYNFKRNSSGNFAFQGLSEQGGFAFEAKKVIWTPDPRLLGQFFQGELPPLLRWRLRQAQNPQALCVGFFATKIPLEECGLRNLNHWMLGARDANACYDNTSPEVLANEGLLYISTGSLRDPRACPPEASKQARGVFQAMFLCPTEVENWEVQEPSLYRVPESKGGQGRAYRVKKETVLEVLKARLEKRFPLLQGQWAWQELGTPLTHERYLNSFSRTGYGFRPSVQDLLIGRPSFDTGIENLFLCGAHIKPAHGIVTALVNGVCLAERILSCDNRKAVSTSNKEGWGHFHSGRNAPC
jgi:all-trans-retinol 13,14-reductase